MSKKPVTSKAALTEKKTKPKTKPQIPYASHAWQCRHERGRSEISAFVEASGGWEVVATIQPTAGASAKAVADYIAGLVNTTQKNGDLLHEALTALEAIVDEGLTYSTEQDADAIIRRIRNH